MRVLFIGNSFTYVHNVPEQVQGIAASLSGPCIQTSMIASGGAMLEDHWRNEAVAARIQEGHWTYVVLNDQSTFGEGWWLDGKSRVGTSGRELAEYGGRFARLVRQSGGVPVFLSHWANSDAPSRDQQVLNYIFARVARQTESMVAQAGIGIKRMQKHLPMLTPYFTDDHHLSAAGAYLEALIIYSTLTGRTPVGAASHLEGHQVEFNVGTVSDAVVVLVDLTQRDADAIQQIAKLTYWNGRGRPSKVAVPSGLKAEFPRVPASSHTISPTDMRGHWQGVSRVLPNPEGTTIDFKLGGATTSDDDTLQMTAGTLCLAGRATVAIEGNNVVVHASLMPVGGNVRGHPAPIAVELRGVIRNGTFIGVATLQQRFANTMSSFDAIGKFEAKRIASPP